MASRGGKAKVGMYERLCSAIEGSVVKEIAVYGSKGELVSNNDPDGEGIYADLPRARGYAVFDFELPSGHTGQRVFCAGKGAGDPIAEAVAAGMWWLSAMSRKYAEAAEAIGKVLVGGVTFTI